MFMENTMRTHLFSTENTRDTEHNFWRTCSLLFPPTPPPFTPPPSTFDNVTSATKRFALDLSTGKVIDAKGYICVGKNVGDVDSESIEDSTHR